MEDNNKHIGKFEWYANDKHYGVIRSYFDNQEYFFHGSNIRDNIKDISQSCIYVFCCRPSFKQKDKIEAYNLQTINLESNHDFILEIYFNDNQNNILLEKKIIREYSDSLLLSKILIRTIDDYEDITTIGSYKRLLITIDSFGGKVPLNTIENRIINKTSEKMKPYLWYDGIINSYDNIFLDTLLFDENINKNKLAKRFVKYFHNEEQRVFDFYLQYKEFRNGVIQYANTSQLLKILEFELSKIEKIDNTEIFEIFYRPLSENPNIEKSKLYDFIDKVYEKSNVHYQAILWLNDFSKKIEIPKLIHIISDYSSDIQHRILRKMFKDCADNSITFSLIDLLPILEFEIKNLQKQISLSVLFAIKVLDIIINKKNPDELYSLIVEYVKKYDSFDCIDEFLEKCNGRTYAFLSNKNSLNNTDTEVKYTTYEDLGIACEGRLAKDKKTIKPILDENVGIPFYWCRNAKCFETSRARNEYPDYFVSDFLHILGYNDFDDEYSFIIGYINRINELMKHLICRKCNKILFPADEGNYGFYRVTLFRCGNKDCLDYLPPKTDYKKEHEKVAYINHCINPYCSEIIDSRDSHQCSNGWFICNYCLACCAKKGIQKRKEVYSFTNQTFQNYTTHNEQGIINCPKCGGEIIKLNLDNYKKSFEWFEKNKNDTKIIPKFGINRLSKHWWLLSKGNWSNDEYKTKLSNLKNYGFEIPDFEHVKDVHLISSTDISDNSILLICQNCDLRIDLLNDFNRRVSIEKFHKI